MVFFNLKGIILQVNATFRKMFNGSKLKICSKKSSGIVLKEMAAI